MDLKPQRTLTHCVSTMSQALRIMIHSHRLVKSGVARWQISMKKSPWHLRQSSCQTFWFALCVPMTLENADMGVIGCHRQCYQRFTAHLQLLKASFQTSASQIHHSPCKESSVTAKSSQLFSPECIFCARLEIKVHGKTERPIKFTSWKHKEAAWKEIKSPALDLGRISLHHQVKGQDLFAIEAQFQAECRMSFLTEQHNHIRGGKREEILDAANG